MICAFCKSEIDNDSFYCDQCSKEQFICPVCGKSGKGKNCIEDGSKLFSAKQKSVAPAQNENQNIPPIISQQNKSIFDKPVQNSSSEQQPSLPNNLPIPVLRLINNNLKIDIEIKKGAVIGRDKGDFIDVFSKFSDISGKHLEFNYDDINGWTVKDTGSDNIGSRFGTQVSPTQEWQTVPKIKPNVSVSLKNNFYILIADYYEFFVKIIPPQSSNSTGTQR